MNSLLKLCMSGLGCGPTQPQYVCQAVGCFFGVKGVLLAFGKGTGLSDHVHCVCYVYNMCITYV